MSFKKLNEVKKMVEEDEKSFVFLVNKEFGNYHPSEIMEIKVFDSEEKAKFYVEKAEEANDDDQMVTFYYYKLEVL